MSSTRKWVLVIVVVALLIGLIGFARGAQHRRGQQIGALVRMESTELEAAK